MPFFYFDLYDGQDLPDRDGTDLPDMEAVQAHAIDVLFTQLKEDARYAMAPQSWTLDVKDVGRHTLFRLQFESFKPDV